LLDNAKREKKWARAYIVGVQRNRMERSVADEHLTELVRLSDTMGVEVAGQEMATMAKPNPKLFVGSGRADTIKETALALEAEVIIFDDELSPAQQRNWEELSGIAVIDRREVILTIFGQRARTREARLQVQVARMEYSLPRLKRAWTHLERQRGGGGFTGGAGEAQIEVDRRIVRDEIHALRIELKNVRLQRANQRKTRRDKSVPSAALVGYTNSGKSSLLNALTGAGVLAEDQLFATLDPTTRKVKMRNNQPLLVTDTVGFIRKLPTMLVEAFKATLEEAQLSDFLMHVVDASHPAALAQIEATNDVLRELDAFDKPMLYVLNKVDLVTDEIALAAVRAAAQPHVLTSVIRGDGLEELAAKMAEMAGQDLAHLRLVIPLSRHDVVSLIHREGKVVSTAYDEDGAHLEVEVPRRFESQLAPFLAPVAEAAP